MPTEQPQGARLRALRALQRGLRWTGAGAVCRAVVRPRGAMILMYHSVPGPGAAPWVDPRNAMAPAVFREQMRFLAARRSVVSMSRLAEFLAAGETPPPGTVALTFDDGYLDNLEIVAPVLAELGLPATLYLPTGYVSRCEAQWVDRLYAAFRARSRDTLALEERTVSGRWSLADADATRAAYGEICRGLIRATWRERESILGAVTRALAADAAMPRLTLTWDEVRSLAGRYPAFEIGGHTLDHTDLSAHDEAFAEEQVRRCAEDLERETGRRPVHFSYPYGRSSDAARRAAAACGFRTAVRGDADVPVVAGTDPLALPRTEAPASPALLAALTDGSGPWLAGALSRLR